MAREQTRMGDMADGAIICEGLVRIFTAQGVEVQALQGLDLRMVTGEMVALVGASGSGKSTLLGILAGLDRPTAGSAHVAGHDLTTMQGAERLEYRRRSVGFVWQQSARNLLPYLSARENIAMVHEVAGVVRRAERATTGDDLLELLGAAEVADKRPSAMSGGQRQRVAIAVALANRPRALLADEPTGELDEHTSAEVLAAMETVNRERGVTTLIVTHDAGVTEHVERTVRIRDLYARPPRLCAEPAQTTTDGPCVLAHEYPVLDRAGRMQLPADFVDALELRERVQLRHCSPITYVSRPASVTGAGPRGRAGCRGRHWQRNRPGGEGHRRVLCCRQSR